MTSAQLKEQREAKLEALNAIVAKVESEGNRALTTDENTQYEALLSEVGDLDTKIDRAVEFEAIKKRAAEQKQPKQPKASPESKAASRFSFIKAIRSQMPQGSDLYVPLEGIEKEMHEEAQREAKADSRVIAGIGIPSMFFANGEGRALTSQTTTTGGHTIETSVGGLIPFLQPRMVVQQLGATFLTGLVGNLDLPVNDAQGSGAWEGEADDNAEVQPTFAKISLTPKRFGGYTVANKQLLAQSSIGVENFMRQNIESLIGQAIDSVAINGGGSGEPTGIIPTSGTGSVTAGALTWEKIVELETDIATANADFGRLAYLTTPGVRGLAKTTVKETGQAIYLWNDNMNASSPGEGVMNGYRAMVSTLVPSTLGGGAEHGLIFGNWAELLIGQWGGIDLVVDPYSLSRKAQIQIVANIWVDVALRHAASFATMEGVTV